MKFKICYEDEKTEFNTEWEYKNYVSAMFAWKTITQTIEEMRRCYYKNCRSGRDMFFKWRIWENTTKNLYLKDETSKILKVYNFKEALK